MTRLYDYWRSSASYRVRMALNLVGEGFDTLPVDLLKAEQVGPDNLARNPQGLVPTLEIDGLSLTQSLGIIEYLNDTRGGLLPADAAGRAVLCVHAAVQRGGAFHGSGLLDDQVFHDGQVARADSARCVRRHLVGGDGGGAAG